MTDRNEGKRVRGNGDESTESCCDFCEAVLPNEPVETTAGTFCCAGCRTAAIELGEDPADTATDPDTPVEWDGPVEHAYLRVDGMHAPTCESFLEAVGKRTPGVIDVEASYVTEAVRITYDPETTSKATIQDALTTTGYTAYRRDEATAEDGTTRRQREIRGVRKRRDDEMLGARYVLGVVFGGFLLVPYLAVLYPTYLASVIPWGPLALYEDAFQTVGTEFLRLYLLLTAAALYVVGTPVLRGAYVSLRMRRPTANLLAAITVGSAFAYGTVAALVGNNHIYYDLAIVVAATVTGAIFYEASIKRAAMDRLTELAASQVDGARRYDDDGTTSEVETAGLSADDRVLVRAGERVPIDGTITDGECTVDEAVVTGESLPVGKSPGSEVVGGSAVVDGAAVVTVGERAESSVERLAERVWDLQSADHGIQRRADRLAGRLAPVVVAVAVIVGIAAIALGAGPAEGTLAALLAVIACSPWLLGVATPLSVAESVRDATERGVVVFDETVFERLGDVDVVVFDKTGTLTTGEMTVVAADAPPDLLAAAGRIERRSSHPVGAAIAEAFGPKSDDRGHDTDGTADTDGDGQTPAGDLPVLDDDFPASDGDFPVPSGETVDPGINAFETHSRGVEGVVDGARVLVGNRELFVGRGWEVPDSIDADATEWRTEGKLPIFVGRDGSVEGLVVVGDRVREGWDEAVSSIAADGAEVIVLTGDDESAVEPFAEHPAIGRAFAGVPPAGKAAAVRRLRSEGRVAMVGDGTNDAPALAEADLGIALGSGTALAADAADVALVEDDVWSVATAFELAGAARERVRRTTRLALVYNAIAIPIALTGLLNPLFAMLAAAVGGGLVAVSATRDELG